MDCGAQVMEEFMDYSGPVKRIGIVKVHLYCPGSVLDRYRETGPGEPLYTNVGATPFSALTARHIKVIGGH